MKKHALCFYGLLLLGFVSLGIVKFLPYGPVFGVSTFLWLFLFILLLKMAETQLERMLTGGVFVLGFIVRFFGIIGIPAIDITFLGLFAMLSFGVIALYWFLTRKKETFLSTLIFPVLWTLVSFLVTLIRVPAVMRIDMMFFHFRALLGSEAFIQSFGLSFVILWMASLLVFAIRKKTWKPLVVSTALFLLTLLSGIIYNATEKPADAFVRVSYGTGMYVGSFLDYEAPPYDECVSCIRSLSIEAKEDGAEILALNEETFELSESEEKAFLEEVKKISKETGLHILFGLDVTSENAKAKSKNKIYWVTPDGELLDEYAKYQTIPILEASYERGIGEIPSHKILINGEEVTVSFAICYDSNFPLYIQKLDKNTDILFLPSWDWKGVAYLHSMLAGTLSVENKVTLLKPTYDGYSLAVNPYGRVLAFQSTEESGYQHVTTIDLPIYRRK